MYFMNENGLNVFSAFNGIGCASYCLEKLGIPINKYYASEIDIRANKIATKNYPKTIHFGDITKIKKHHFLDEVDFMCGGSPCQDLSIAGKMAGLDGSRSRLFFEFIRLWNELGKPLFFFENVRMKKHSQDRISELFGCEPIPFDSALVSAQTRKRLYWTNLVSKDDFIYPEDKGIVLNDILEFGYTNDDKSFTIPATYSFAVENDYLHKKQRQMIKNQSFISQGGKFKLTEKANTIDANYFKGIGCNQARTCIKIGEVESNFDSSSRVYSPLGKSPCINTQQEIKVANINVNPSGKVMNGIVHKTNRSAPTLTTNKGEGIKIEYADTYRKLTPIEVERCFSLPYNYTKGISNSARYHGLGNGWECATIMEFFKYLL